MSLILNGTTGISDVDGTAAAPALTGTDSNTGIFFPAADTIAFAEGGVEAVRIDASGNLLVGTTTSTNNIRLNQKIAAVTAGSGNYGGISNTSYSGTGAGVAAINDFQRSRGTTDGSMTAVASDDSLGYFLYRGSDGTGFIDSSIIVAEVDGTVATSQVPGRLVFKTASSAGSMTERARITSGGSLLVGTTTTSTNSSTNGFVVGQSGETQIYRDSAQPLVLNRNTNDGALVSLRQADIEEGNISVSGTTVSYNGGHLSRWAQTTAPKDDTLVKGTVLSNLDEMNVYTDADGNPVDNEQLNKVKVSDVEGDANVAGVFVNWSHDEDHNVDEINMAMTGDMIIRIAQGTTVARGDLLMSAGDGTAKPQGDDIVRSKTVAKVTSTHVTCTYADGSFCVPCVLMAC